MRGLKGLARSRVDIIATQNNTQQKGIPMRNRSTITSAVLISILLFASAALAQNQNPNGITWKMNPAKSKTSHYQGLFKSSTIRFEELKDSSTKAQLDVVLTDGSALKRTWTAKCDGKDYPVAAPDTDMMSCTTPDVNTTDYMFKKNGKEVWRGRAVTAQDGKTSIDNGSGTDDRGKPFTYSMFMEKQ
jgi:hypothetical protein